MKNILLYVGQSPFTAVFLLLFFFFFVWHKKLFASVYEIIENYIEYWNNLSRQSWKEWFLQEVPFFFCFFSKNFQKKKNLLILTYIHIHVYAQCYVGLCVLCIQIIFILIVLTIVEWTKYGTNIFMSFISLSSWWFG